MSIRTRKILILAGEESGDLHGSYLIEALLSLSLPLQIFAMGGDKMKLAGAKLLENTLESSVVGITEVIRKIRPFGKKKAHRRFCKSRTTRFSYFYRFPWISFENNAQLV